MQLEKVTGLGISVMFLAKQGARPLAGLEFFNPKPNAGAELGSTEV